MKNICTADDIGDSYPNGSFTGIMNSLMNKEVDFAVDSVVLSPERNRFLQSHSDVLLANYGIWFKVVDTTYIPNHFSAFSSNIWFIFISSFLLAAVILSVALKQTPLAKTNQHLPLHSRWSNRANIANSTFLKLFSTWRWFIFGEFLEQAIENAPGFAVKILLGTLNVICTLGFLHYTSQFSSVLTSQPQVLPFTSMESLSQNLQYRIGLSPGTGVACMLKESTDKVYQTLWERYLQRKDNSVSGIREAISKLCQEDKYAFLYGLETASIVVTQMKMTNCSLKVIPITVLKSAFLVGMTYDFAYARTVSNQIVRLKETGLMDRVRQKYLKNSADHRVSRNIQYTNAIFVFGFPHVIIPLSILAVGIALALLILVLEMAIHYYDTTRLSKAVLGRCTKLGKEISLPNSQQVITSHSYMSAKESLFKSQFPVEVKK